MLGGDILTAYADGLPGIEGTFSAASTSNSATGAFSSIASNQGDWRGSENRYTQTITFSAKKFNSIYGKSDVVMPASFCLIPQIKF